MQGIRKRSAFFDSDGLLRMGFAKLHEPAWISQKRAPETS